MVGASALVDTVSNGRRRLVLYCLENADGELPVVWLDDRMLAREECITVDRVGRERTRRVPVVPTTATSRNSLTPG